MARGTHRNVHSRNHNQPSNSSPTPSRGGQGANSARGGSSHSRSTVRGGSSGQSGRGGRSGPSISAAAINRVANICKYNYNL